MEELTTAQAAMLVFGPFGGGGPQAWGLIPEGPDRPAARRALASRDWLIGVVNREGERYFMPVAFVLAYRIARQPADREYLAELVAAGEAIPAAQISTEAGKKAILDLQSAVREAQDLKASPESKLLQDLNPPDGAQRVAAWYGMVLGKAVGLVGTVVGPAAAAAFAGLGPVGVSIIVGAGVFVIWQVSRRA